jgi:hypothetical protein
LADKQRKKKTNRTKTASKKIPTSILYFLIKDDIFRFPPFYHKKNDSQAFIMNKNIPFTGKKPTNGVS